MSAVWILVAVQGEGDERQTACRCSLASLFTKVDEIVGYSNLGANVAELRPDGEEEIGLLAEWSGIVLGNFEFLGAHIS